MFNVHINDGTEDLPEDDIYYIVAKEGIFLRKKLGIMDSIAPVDKISTLDSITASAKMNIKKIPEPTIAKVVDFFRKVYEEHRSEAVVLLFYQEENKKYRIVPPYQKVSAASIDYNRGITLDGWTMIGTIHSHAAMSAFHSGTDQGDEETFDGLHITIGNLGSSDVSISASIVANGYRVMVDPEEYIDGIKKVSDVDEKVPYYTRKVYKYDKGKLVLDEDQSKKFIQTHRKYDKRYTCTAPPSKSSCNPSWLKVVEKSYPSYGYSLKNRQYGLHNWRSGYDYRQHNNYGYNHNFDPTAWQRSGRHGITYIGPDEGKIEISTGENIYSRNQAIIDNMSFENEDKAPCLTCKHREFKILMEEDDTEEEYLFYCTKCKKMYTETELESNEEAEGYECPKCKSDEHFEIVDEKEFKSNYEEISNQIFNKQPDQHGFFKCKVCKNSFLKLSTDVECPICQADLYNDDKEDKTVSTETLLVEKEKKDSGTYLGGITDEAHDEMLKQAAENDKKIEKIHDPEQDAIPLTAKPGTLFDMFKRVFKSEKS